MNARRKTMKRISILSSIAILLFITLSGCLFPDNELAKNKTPNEDQINMVQTAVEQYQEDTNGLLPIKTKEADVDIYEKYLIDFNMLKDNQLLSETPATAYENGGTYQYTLIDVEEDPTVKLIDLRLAKTVSDVNRKLNIYRSKHTYPPFGDKIENGIYKLNYDKLGYEKEPTVPSPYTKNNLPLIIDESGEVFIDYRVDIQQEIDEHEVNYEEGEDIRSLFTDHYPFVPAYSKPYTIQEGEITFLEKE